MGSHVPANITKEASEFLINYKRNPHYFDKHFLNSKNTLRDVVYTYKEQEAKSAQQSAYANFVQGRINRVDFQELNEEVLKLILSNNDQKVPRDNVTFTINVNKFSIP